MTATKTAPETVTLALSPGTAQAVLRVMQDRHLMRSCFQDPDRMTREYREVLDALDAALTGKETS